VITKVVEPESLFWKPGRERFEIALTITESIRYGGVHAKSLRLSLHAASRFEAWVCVKSGPVYSKRPLYNHPYSCVYFDPGELILIRRCDPDPVSRLPRPLSSEIPYHTG
jgi:hypothetical protein